MARIRKEPTAPFSPYYGCFIITTAVVVFAGLITWTLYSLFSQDRQIAEFTTDAPVSLETAPLLPHEQSVLLAKVAAFASAAADGQTAELSLTLVELNALLDMAPDTGHGSYRGMIRFRATDPSRNALVADVSLPMNTARFWENKKRYLVGEAVFALSTNDEGIDARVIDVKVPGKPVPPGFIGVLESFGWVNPYRQIEGVGAALKAVRTVTVTAEGVTVATAPR